jgi:hypothetical protein
VTAREWKPGDRALLPVTVVDQSSDDWVKVELPNRLGPVDLRPNTDLLPDTRPPSWLPGQRGDVAEWDGQRWMRGRRWWWVDDEDFATHSMSDDDVPADSVLVLPAKTREAQ